MTRCFDVASWLAWCGALATFVVLVSSQDPTSRQVEIFVNVYDHPKTGFSCADKAPGQYYADPATKCAVYYVCLANPTGTMSPQSFACPNGTIFSQATRVCRPVDEVYCPLAARYYDNVQGIIDEKREIEVPPAVPLAPASVSHPVQPVSHSQSVGQPRRQSSGQRAKVDRTPVERQPQAPVLLQNVPAQAPALSAPQAPTRTAAQSSNLFNSNNRFRNSRTFPAASSTTTTTSTPAPPPPPPANVPSAGGAAAGAADYEYDYNDYSNETTLANAASSLHAQIIANVAEAIAKDTKESEAAAKAVQTSATVNEAAPLLTATYPENKAITSRRKRQTHSDESEWMLNRRKGELLEQALAELVTLTDTLVKSNTTDSDATTTATPSTAFTCEDKIAGVAYADIESNCVNFYLCVSVSKGKQTSYQLSCDQGRRFNQALGMCDSELTEKQCQRSEQYYAYHKWHKPSKKHLIDSAKKMTKLTKQ